MSSRFPGIVLVVYLNFFVVQYYPLNDKYIYISLWYLRCSPTVPLRSTFLPFYIFSFVVFWKNSCLFLVYCIPNILRYLLVISVCENFSSAYKENHFQASDVVFRKMAIVHTRMRKMKIVMPCQYSMAMKLYMYLIVPLAYPFLVWCEGTTMLPL